MKLRPEDCQFYDEAAARLAQIRYTLPEREIMQAAWKQRHDIPIYYDYADRFVEVGGDTDQPHWRLKEHMLANDRLFNDLLTGTWDGQNLDDYLEQLDRESRQYHVFYPPDKRFRQNRQGTWELLIERTVDIPEQVQQALHLHKPALLARWQEQATDPLTGQQILTQLKESGWQDASDSKAFLYLRSWLLQEPEFTRVGQDYWMLSEHLPAEVQRVRLTVPPQRDAEEEQGSQPYEQSTAQAVHAKVSRQPGDSKVTIAGELARLWAGWTECLLAIHLQEGFIPIPKKVRDIYPPLAPGEGKIFAIQGRWFDDATVLWLWVDRQNHRLYGPDLRDLFDRELLEPGTNMQIRWEPDCIFLRRVSINEKIFEEEGRLINLEEIKQLRGGIGESYRRSLQAILEANPHGLTLAELIVQVRQRQQHPVHTGMIRSLLSSGGFIHKGQHWFAAPDGTRGARQLRRVLLESLVSPEQITTKAVSREAFIRTRALTIQKRLREIVDDLKE